MKTLGETLKLSASYLQERKIGEPRRQAEDLLAHVLSLKRIDLYMQYDRPLEEKELGILRELLKKRGKGEPHEYIVGETLFYGCKIRVDRSVLIPRPETEILVDLIGKKISGKKVLWDLCTGSGCIGISLKKAFPELKVVLSDISPEALAVAKENARINEVDVECREGDLLAPFAGEKADYVVCNPPYISSKEYLTLDRSVADFEPKLALVGGERGDEFYGRLARELPAYLNAGASAFFELGTGQGEVVKNLFSDPLWTQRELKKDWAGHDRFFFLEKQ
ncbi:MAG: peptide chain release factor N(5)-glutamine methyltransferase [Verrucomicrobia bacterium]|nr:peptide chain release factor N(5)-glutamine methyltransferase [Verrucomicrobiota bacterium]